MNPGLALQAPYSAIDQVQNLGYKPLYNSTKLYNIKISHFHGFTNSHRFAKSMEIRTFGNWFSYKAGLYYKLIYNRTLSTCINIGALLRIKYSPLPNFAIPNFVVFSDL